MPPLPLQKSTQKFTWKERLPFCPCPIVPACSRGLGSVCGVLYKLPCLGILRWVRQWKPSFDQGDRSNSSLIAYTVQILYYLNDGTLISFPFLAGTNQCFGLRAIFWLSMLELNWCSWGWWFLVLRAFGLVGCIGAFWWGFFVFFVEE